MLHEMDRPLHEYAVSKKQYSYTATADDLHRRVI